jgi:tripartite-type tricarboxylate transporter receptor subunit TctC
MTNRTMRSLVLVAAATLSTQLGAQAFPNKPIRVVYPFPESPFYRPLVEKMSSILGQNVLLDSRPGGGSTVGSAFVKSQPPDGYTVLIATNSVVVKSLAPKPQIDIIKDFVPISQINKGSLMISVNVEQIKATNLRELLDEARRRPGAINYASYGTGSGAHLLFEMVLNEAKVSMTHVPFQGPAQAIVDTVAGRTQTAATIGVQLRPHVASMGGSGALRMVAASTAERFSLYPEVVGMKESGLPQIDLPVWAGLVGPAGMSREIVDALNRVMVEAGKDPKLDEFFRRGGSLLTPSTPAELGRQIEIEYSAYAKLIKDRNLQLE